jgi:hypothetical protein
LQLVVGVVLVVLEHLGFLARMELLVLLAVLVFLAQAEQVVQESRIITEVSVIQVLKLFLGQIPRLLFLMIQLKLVKELASSVERRLKLRMLEFIVLDILFKLKKHLVELHRQWIFGQELMVLMSLVLIRV